MCGNRTSNRIRRSASSNGVVDRDDVRGEHVLVAAVVTAEVAPEGESNYCNNGDGGISEKVYGNIVLFGNGIIL